MFERFTDRARRVMVLAEEEARMLNHNYIGTEHLLLGLVLEPEGVAARALESLEISPEAVRQQVEEIVGQGQQAPSGHIAFTPRAKKVMELARREAKQLGHNYIGTEHILLGLIREGGGVAAQVLVQLGADLDRVRQRVIQLLHGTQGMQPGMTWAVRRSGKAGGRERWLLSEILSGVESIDSRLSAIGQLLGAGPDVSDLDQQIAQARRGKEAAAGAEDYESAAALRDRERQLLADRTTRQQEWASAHPDLASLAEEFHRLGEEAGRLRDLLRGQGMDLQDGAALPASACDRKCVLAMALRVQEFDKGRGPVGLPPIGQACHLPAWPGQGPREGSLVKSRSGPAAPAVRRRESAAAKPPPSEFSGPRGGLVTGYAGLTGPCRGRTSPRRRCRRAGRRTAAGRRAAGPGRRRGGRRTVPGSRPGGRGRGPAIG
jgi:Clp amino terminal domain, pathogenicity island component